jgi:uncharacterized protein YjbI with pentapeptide repeats
MNNYPDFSKYGYQIEQELGHNRAGGRVTYKAIALATQQPVVIKKFQLLGSKNWAEYETYEREIQVLKQLNHPSIPLYLDKFETPTGFCLVTEYKHAPSLALRRNFTPEEIKQIAIAVLEILEYLQQQNPPVIHRDIKPENILVDSTNGIKVYLVDFGFAHLSGQDVAVSSIIKGTLGFMPPEQMFHRQLTEASDLYSLGATLICLLAGIKSIDIGDLIDESFRLDVKQLKLKLNRQAIAWLQKMVAVNLKERYPNAATALNALRSIEVTNNSATSKTLLSYFKPKVLAPIVGLATVSAVAFAHTTKISNWLKFSGKRLLDNASVTQFWNNAESQIPDLENLNLQGADLSYINLKFACLRGKDLRFADFRLACLQGADLRNANLEQANLEGADLRNANLKGASLERANLENANLENADLEEVNLKNANLKRARLWEVNLQNANLAGADLTRTSLWDALLVGANLSNAYLINTNFRGADLTNANLKGAYLKGVYLQGAIAPNGKTHHKVLGTSQKN